MATYNFQPVLLSISLTFFLLLLNKGNSTESLSSSSSPDQSLPSSLESFSFSSPESISFSFPKFEPDQPNLLLQGDAIIPSTGELQLAKLENGKPVPHSVGRALHIAPIHIWDSTTGNLASFVTSFSFIINAPNEATTTTADGLAFFLAPVNSQPQEPGALLGLFKDQDYDKSNQIVAIEFDTYLNDWDPCFLHIGINVNSIQSSRNVSWDLAKGQLALVEIRYEASTKSLSASLVYPSLEKSYIVDETVDLKDVLPEWVRVGFSAATGDYAETHDVLAWSFESKLPDGNCNALEENNAHL